MEVPYVWIGLTNMRIKEGCSLGNVLDDSAWELVGLESQIGCNAGA